MQHKYFIKSKQNNKINDYHYRKDDLSYDG